jgi:hypothetical protein
MSEGDSMEGDDVYTPLTFSVQSAEPEVSSVFSSSCCYMFALAF